MGDGMVIKLDKIPRTKAPKHRRAESTEDTPQSTYAASPKQSAVLQLKFDQGSKQEHALDVLNDRPVFQTLGIRCQ